MLEQRFLDNDTALNNISSKLKELYSTYYATEDCYDKYAILKDIRKLETIKSRILTKCINEG